MSGANTTNGGYSFPMMAAAASTPPAAPPAPAPAPTPAAASTGSGLLTPKTIEDFILLAGPILTAASGFDWGVIIPGLNGFVIGAAISSMAKSFAGIGQNGIKNWEDSLSLLITALGIFAGIITQNAMLLTYGTLIGFLAKALPSMLNGLNIEDVALTIGTLLSAAGAYLNMPSVLDMGILLAVFGKGMPSVATNGAAGGA